MSDQIIFKHYAHNAGYIVGYHSVAEALEDNPGLEAPLFADGECFQLIEKGKIVLTNYRVGKNKQLLLERLYNPLVVRKAEKLVKNPVLLKNAVGETIVQFETIDIAEYFTRIKKSSINKSATERKTKSMSKYAEKFYFSYRDRRSKVTDEEIRKMKDLSPESRGGLSFMDETDKDNRRRLNMSAGIIMLLRQKLYNSDNVVTREMVEEFIDDLEWYANHRV